MSSTRSQRLVYPRPWERERRDAVARQVRVGGAGYTNGVATANGARLVVLRSALPGVAAGFVAASAERVPAARAEGMGAVDLRAQALLAALQAIAAEAGWLPVLWRIAERAGIRCTEDQVSQALQRLADNGVIVRERSGRRRTLTLIDAGLVLDSHAGPRRVA